MSPPQVARGAPSPAAPRRAPRYFAGRLRAAAAVVVAGILITGVLAWTSATQYQHNENRLINLRVREAGNLISGALPSIQTPLASAAALADASRGDASVFSEFIKSYVGPSPHTYVSASIWAVGSATPVAVVGKPPSIADNPTKAAAFFGRSTGPGVLRVTEILEGQRRLGYAFQTPGKVSTYIAYGEAELPANRRLRIDSNSAFADLDYALYVGKGTDTANLLATSVDRLPITSRHATTVIPFGDSSFTLVMTARRPISGTLSQRLPWIIVLVGLILTIGAVLLTDRLVRRRQVAERLVVTLDRVAEENRLLYAEQRTVAETLQHALLPEALPQRPGVESAVQYLPGVKGMHIGGDWYDLIALDGNRMLFVVGDVSGRGVRAAAVMASLLYAVRAYAAEGDGPVAILEKLSRLSSVERDGHFATVLCAEIDVPGRRMTIANAGHLPPVIVHAGGAELVKTEVGVPVGVSATRPYSATEVVVPPGATLLGFTDGLVERRGESIDVSLERLRSEVAGSSALPLMEYLTDVIADLLAGGVDDDAVLLGVRWAN